MKTVAVVTSKGGSGKTTIAFNLAVAAYLGGRRVLIADLDPQHASVMAMKARGMPGPGCIATTGGKLFQLTQTARGSGIDLLIIDTPGASGAEQAEAMRAADLCVVVARPTFFDLATAVSAADTVRRLGRLGLAVLNQAAPARLGVEPPIVTKARAGLRLSGLEVADVTVRLRAAHQVAVMNGQGVMEWEPAGHAAREISALWAQVEGLLKPSIPAPVAIRPAFLAARPPVTIDLAQFR